MKNKIKWTFSKCIDFVSGYTNRKEFQRDYGGAYNFCYKYGLVDLLYINIPKSGSKEYFLKKATERHGVKYSYDNVNLINFKTKVEIECPIHGMFLQSPHNHCFGKGCRKCAGRHSPSTKEAVEILTIKRGFIYSYELFASDGYSGKKDDLIRIICSKHGIFKQSYNNHKRGQNCPSCMREITHLKVFRTAYFFLVQAYKVHGAKYSYEYSIPKRQISNIKIKCFKHGCFIQNVGNHLSGKGCPKCGHAAGGDKNRMTFVNFEKKAMGKHGDKYNYSKVKIVNMREDVEIICPLHGSFLQRPSHHTNGAGCPTCSPGGFNKNQPGILYYLVNVYNGVTKIGITNHSVEKRYNSVDLENFAIVKIWRYCNGDDARKIESYILKNYKQYKYNGPPLLSSGNSELFTTDILGLLGYPK